jgi:hypothetical protein
MLLVHALNVSEHFISQLDSLLILGFEPLFVPFQVSLQDASINAEVRQRPNLAWLFPNWQHIKVTIWALFFTLELLLRGLSYWRCWQSLQ